MNIPRLGELAYDAASGCHYSEAVMVPVFGNSWLSFEIEGMANDTAPAEFAVAIAHFLALGPQALHAVSAALYAYYEDCAQHEEPGDPDFPWIASPRQAWELVRPGVEISVARRPHGDARIYLSVECTCGFEPEHGLQIVFKEGLRVSKLGPFDGHLSNADAYDDPALEDVVYR